MSTFGRVKDPYEATSQFYSDNPFERYKDDPEKLKALMAFYREQARQGLINAKGLGIRQPIGARGMQPRPSQDPSGRQKGMYDLINQARDEHLRVDLDKPIVGTLGTAYANPLGFVGAGVNDMASVDYAAQSRHMAAARKKQAEEDKEDRKMWRQMQAQFAFQRMLDDERQRRALQVIEGMDEDEDEDGHNH